jgi:uncharacterized protein YraI
MSSQALVLSGSLPIIKYGTFITVNTGPATTITYDTPFPVGAVPIILLTNSSGGNYNDYLVNTQSGTNTIFTCIQTPPTGDPLVVFAVNYLAIWNP